ncbi:MAG: hypothetical protein AAB336_01510 [Acidobacteriota bacterium]
MESKRSKLKSILPKTVSAVLVFWLSSVLVLVCCSPHLLMASAKEMDESCPMSKGHDCCQKNKDAKTLSEKEKDKVDCCVYKPTRTLSADLQTVKITKQTQVETEKIETPKPVYFIQTSYKPTKVYHSAICNRGSTYLQNCVFRI